MMPRKKRITIISIIIVILVIAILGTLSFLYLKTDAFKSNETLFAKYLIQNFNTVEELKSNNSLGIEEILNTNKYESDGKANIEYTENVGTSDENKNSSINKVGIKIKSNVDRTNNYNYKDISIGTDENDLIKLEYLNEDETYAIRLNGIQQFVSMNGNEENKTIQGLGISNISELLSSIDIDTIFNFTEQEKQTLMNTYLKVLQSNISKDKYYKQSNSLITVNNKSIKVNAYYIKFTIEDYNNLLIEILKQITDDKIILSKIDLIEDTIKEKYSKFEQAETLRQQFINYINEKISEIQSKNIGSDEVKIMIYENSGKTVRTSIEKITQKITVDLYNDSSIKIDNVELGETTKEQFVKIEKTNSNTESNILVEYKNIKDNEIINNIEFTFNQSSENNQISKIITLAISNEKYEGILNIENNIKLVDNFEEQITLNDDNNVKLDNLNEEQKQVIMNIISENIQGQISNLISTVNMEDYEKMFQNLQLAKNSSIQILDETGVTEVEKKRFNSQFEFFATENLTSDNIVELLKIVQENFEEMKVLLKDGSIIDLDVSKLQMKTEEDREYVQRISEILIAIKSNSKNEEKQEAVSEFLENNENNKYTVSLEYDNDGLVNIIRIKIQ